MSDIKQVKVDNWGVYFLQRLKHFFNRTDFCDLTLQFQDNAQLKVHRLVLNACTEYFELLERTCEMYEDCLVMPDDLQADVVVPIVNFMYTGQLEFKMDLLEKLYQTSQIMSMPVLTKLLDAHRQSTPVKPAQCYTGKRKRNEPIPSTSSKRSYNKAHETSKGLLDKKSYISIGDRDDSYSTQIITKSSTNQSIKESRPTRYELPEELDTDNVFDNSFCNISYTSKPLMVHPETVKRYSARRSDLFSEASSSKRFSDMTSTMDIVECKKIKNESIFEDGGLDTDESNDYAAYINSSAKDPNQLFDQMLDQDESIKITGSKKNKGIQRLDHAKIISEVLKKYSHMLKGSKNVKLKILNNPKKIVTKEKYISLDDKSIKDVDYTYETDVIDSKRAAKLIAMGAENTKGPWICLICGTPGKSLHFTTYYKFRRHLVEVHKEKPVINMCEYCGHKSFKRNYLLHHLYTKHNIKPPAQYNFPKCNVCSYVALSDGLLIKHKQTHSGVIFRCNVCSSQFSTSRQLLLHIQNTGHKYSADRKNNLQCVYCLKLFLRETNLFTHLKTYHRNEAKSDGIIEDSDEESVSKEDQKNTKIEVEIEPTPTHQNDFEEVDVQYQIQPDGNIHVISSKKQKIFKQNILNCRLDSNISKPKPIDDVENIYSDFLEDTNVSSLNDKMDEIVTIDSHEYIVRNNRLIPNKSTNDSADEEYILPELVDPDQNIHTATSTTSMEFTNMHGTNVISNMHQSGVIVSKANTINQPIQIVVSNDEEYKALITSNNPIIIDNTDNGKTLTVLTAPHGTALDTAAINLNNTQPNDMMIIQEEFPIAVTENVPTDNSNIVVVYSHPVDNQNKQYQLLTTQAIETQFVPPTAIIAQNFETITTTAPVVNTHVVNAQEVWQNDVHQAISNQELQITSEAAIQTNNNKTVNNQIVTQENVSDTNLDDIPEVQLVPDTEESKHIITQETVENNDDSKKIIETPINAELVDTEQEINPNNITIPMETDGIATKSLDFESANETSTETIGESETIMSANDTIQTIEQPESILTNEADSTLQMAEISENIELTKTLQTCESSSFTQDLEETVTPNESIKEQNNENIGENMLPNGTIKEIQNLTLEWSEDEDDAKSQDNVSEENRANELINENNSTTLENQRNIEESTQSIQEDMEKQNNIETTSNIDEQGTNQQSKDASVPTSSSVNQAETNIPTETVNTSQEKISSLLNEWEDNDSQEPLTEQNHDNTVTPIVVNNQDTIPTTEVDNQNILNQAKSNDNIQKLVSDWDDDEEESKE